MKLLIDADTVLELFLGRDNFIEDVKYLKNLLDSSSFDLYVTKIGLDKIRKHLKLFVDQKKYIQIIRLLKTRIFCLPINSTIASEALAKPLVDIESAMEVAIAEKMQLGAIITHKLNDFVGASLQVLSLKQIKQRTYLEKILNLNEFPIILTMKKREEIKELNRLFEIKTSQNNLEHSLSSPSTINLEIQNLVHKVTTIRGQALVAHQALARSINDQFSAFRQSTELSRISEARRLLEHSVSDQASMFKQVQIAVLEARRVFEHSANSQISAFKQAADFNSVSEVHQALARSINDQFSAFRQSTEFSSISEVRRLLEHSVINQANSTSQS